MSNAGKGTVPEAEQGTVPDAWEGTLSDPWLPWAVRVAPRSAPDAFRAEVQRHRLDDVTVIDRCSDSFSGARGPREIAATDGDFLVVRIVRCGNEVFRRGGDQWLLEAGDAIVWESDRPARFDACGPVVTRSLVMPRRSLHDVGCPLTASNPPAAGRLPAVNLLAGYLDALDATLPALSGPPGVAARNALLELVWGALRPATPLDPQAVRPARWAAVEHYLDTHLGRSDLSADEVAATHGISVRTLGRLFTEHGGTFTGILRAKRIARVRDDLLTSDVTIEALARRWGFFDTSHLNRRFRAVHELSPHEYRLRHREAVSDVQRVASKRPSRTP
ncbi:helix-turn-helix domain-containing protein [Streptomyces zagrosensis]|uniref:AraC-like DNA-binding protein n=1 Tax=Streptomyces zagrosensis TaxID=1042984 RepID=A0A7W9UW93_9ACTN|nr:helix-turn-helix domain-containing protein [Streptomyces zagrosensis]MBB5933076.1 AraC-like DNA-binding protein [Streptomyces zagrosensis]